MENQKIEILDKLSTGEITAQEAEKLLLNLAGNDQVQVETEQASERGSFLDRLVSIFGGRAEFKEESDWTLDGADVSIIHAKTSNGSISLCGAEQEMVTVHAWKKVNAFSERTAEEFAQQVQIHVERHQDEIRIYVEHPRPPLGTSVSVRYEISGPRGAGAKLRTSNGAIKVYEIDGGLEAVTSNGAIKLHGGAGEVNLRTSNGAIHLQDTRGNIRADTSNGKIDASLEQLQEGIFSTSNGSMDIVIREGNAPVTAKTSNGTIRLTLPPDFSGQLDAKTSHGRVRSELPVSVSQGARNRLVGQVGEGGETAIKLRTMNGGIHLKTH